MSSTFSIPTWTKENCTLHDAICHARVAKESADSLRQLLHSNKEKFLVLLDNEGKNHAHQSTLNSNRAYINGSAHNVSKEFVSKTLFLSNQLDINEYVAATLLMRATSEFSRANSNSIDTAVLLFHSERGYLLACLDVILKSAKDGSISEEVRSVCNEFVTDLVQEKLDNGESYVSKLLSTLDHLTKVINSIINTGTAVGQVPEPGSGKLGDDISELRIERLGDERVYIVQIIYHITSLFNIDTQDKLTMLEMLEDAKLDDPATSYMIVAMLSALSNDSSSDEMSIGTSTLDFINKFHHRIMTHGSKVPVIKAVVVLQWVLYLSDPARINEATGEGVRSQEIIQELLDFSIATDVFRFMDEYLLYFQQPNAKICLEHKPIKEDDSQGTTKTIDISDYHNFSADIRSEFQPFVIYELEKVGILTISTVFSTLQKLKYKEEDTNIPVQTPLSAGNALLGAEDNSYQCHDLEYFLTFLASVFRNRVNNGVVFWNREQGGLHYFIRWLLDIKVTTTVRAAFDFFASITAGDACASNMYHFFKADMEPQLASSALFSWGKPLAALEFYTNHLRDATEEPPSNLPEVEEQLIITFLGLLQQCVQYSQDARVTFWFDQSIGAKNILINIISCPTSTRLRAALFDVLAAFCSSWGGGINGVGKKISNQMWYILEESDMFLPKLKVNQERTQSVRQPAGVLRELEAEKHSRVFMETLAATRLIGSAIHTQSRREALISGFRKASSSIPLDLGKGGKNPGSSPFISLVVDDIFPSLATHKYNFANARWELTEACLIVMENSIASLDISQLENEQVRESLDKELKVSTTNAFVENMLLDFFIHPGFQVMVRILSGGRIVDELFSVIEECAQKGTKAEPMRHVKQCLVRSLRIILQVLKMQYTFCNILMLYISAFAKKKGSSEFQLGTHTFAHLPSVVSMGQLILFNSPILNRISLLVNFEDQEEICFLSTKILHLLSVDPKDANLFSDTALVQSSTSTHISGLGQSITNMLGSSNNADTVIFGVSERLSISVPEVTTADDYEYDINNIPFWLAAETLENTFNYPSDFKPRLDTSVRLAILDLLLENTQQSYSPTLAEFLLGYDVNGDNLTKLQDTDSNQSTLICLHAILDMLRQGIDNDAVTDDPMMEDTAEPAQLLIETHPILADKCYELVYKLCSIKSLSTSTLRYLRNRENFCYKQFNSMSSRLEHNIQMESASFSGMMVCADGSIYKTDFFKLRSKLRQRAWLLQTIALELHTTVGMQQKNEASKLLELLYGRHTIISQDDMDTAEQSYESGFSSSRTKYEQPLVKMLELVSSLNFTWVDSLLNGLQSLELKYFQQIDPAFFQIRGSHGCTLYNVPAMYKKLREVQESLYAESLEHAEIEKEMGQILSWAMAQNHDREIAHGKLQCLDAWKEIIIITLVECFDILETSSRQAIIYELLALLLPTISQTKSHSNSMLKSMNAVILTLVDSLRGTKEASAISQQLPVDKLGSIFMGIVNCICGDDTDIIVRGDMYSALTSFLLYLKEHNTEEVIKQVERFIVEKISAKESTLLNIISSDAINGLDIWKTTAYIALDSLNTTVINVGSTAVQQFLVRKNFLQFTIEMIRSDDAALSNLLEQLDAPLLPLYIFEAKMSILLRFAMNPSGAELLCNNRIFEILGQCQFMKAQIQNPTLTEMNLESSMELVERRQQLVMPTLQVIVSILCCFGGKNDTVLAKAENWARKQQLALVDLLKYERRPITLTLLQQLKLVTTIVYFMSCRTGYTTNFTKRGINQLNSAITQLEITEDLASSVISTNDQERIWDKTLNTSTPNVTILQTKATNLIKLIKRNADVYKAIWIK
ncbi:nucleoporin Nup186/Nup192/Nup205 [Parasitella parasitica]|nr:nucleoporin Nup186/Nup192/Nup205 [Parasitella parasitica]